MRLIPWALRKVVCVKTQSSGSSPPMCLFGGEGQEGGWDQGLDGSGQVPEARAVRGYGEPWGVQRHVEGEGVERDWEGVEFMRRRQRDRVKI